MLSSRAANALNVRETEPARAAVYKLPLFWPMFTIWGTAMLGMVFAYDNTLALPTVLSLVVSVFIFYIVAIPNQNLYFQRWVRRIVLLIGLIIALFYITQYKDMPIDRELGFIDRIARQISGFVPRIPALVRLWQPTANTIAFMLEGIFILAFAGVLHSTRILFRLYWLVASGILFYALFITASRGTLLGLALAFALAIWVSLYSQFRNRWIVWGGGVVMFALVGLMLAGFFGYLVEVPLLGSTVARIFDRFNLYRSSFYLALDYPLTGIGAGMNFAQVYSRYSLDIIPSFLLHPHNMALATWLGQGLPGIIVYFWTIIAFYAFVIRVLRASGDVPVMFHASWLAVTVTFAHGLLDAEAYGTAWMILPIQFVLIGISVARGVHYLRHLGEYDQPFNLLTLAWVPVLGLALAGFLSFVPMGQSLWKMNEATNHETWALLRPNLDDSERAILTERARQEYEAALELDPNIVALQRRYGNFLADANRFEEAIPYLEYAQSAEPYNMATRKMLGLAYAWTGQIDAAVAVMEPMDGKHADIGNELDAWAYYWTTENFPERSEAAQQLRERLFG